MNHSDIAALMKGVAPVIRDYLAGAVQPLVDKIADLEGRINALPKAVEPAEMERRIEAFAADLKAGTESIKAEGKEKRKAALADLRAGIVAECEAIVSAKFAELPDWKDQIEGASIAYAEVFARKDEVKSELDDIRAAVKAFPEAIELPEIPPLPDIPSLISEAVGKSEGKILLQTEDLIAKRVILELADRAPQDGKDADPALVASLVAEHVERAVAAIPAPKDGHSPTAEELALAIAEVVQRAVSALPVAKDGVSLAGAVIDRDGGLILTLSDGTTRELGRVVGKDGADADMEALQRRADEMVAALPKPKDGKDGFGFDDFDVTYDGERTFAFKFARAADVKEFAFSVPVVLDRGVWKEGGYKAGDGVTWGGSFWIAQKDNDDKPDAGNGSWRLAVKKGRDGKDGELKAPREQKPVKVGN
jgi:hypothetical protein